MILGSVEQLVDSGGSLEEAAILYRVHAQSRVLEEHLRTRGIPYRVIGGTRFYDRAEIKDLIYYLRLIGNPDDQAALERIINRPARGIGKTTLDRILSRASEEGGRVWAALLEAAADPRVRARKKLRAFVELIESLRAHAAAGEDLPTLGSRVLEQSGTLNALEVEGTVEAESRMQNLEELVGSMADFQREFAAEHGEEAGLEAFLEHVALASSADAIEEGERLSLMTVHGAKGLEFEMVVVAGVEEGLFPFRRQDAIEDPEDLEEERRLAYVAFTRARKHLLITHTRVRQLFGRTFARSPSRFIREMPPDDLKLFGDAPRASSYGGSAAHGSPAYASQAGAGQSAARPPSRSEGSWIDRSEGSDLGDEGLAEGGLVRHPKFGIGRVLRLIPGADPKAEIHFEGVGPKQILLRFLQAP